MSEYTDFLKKYLNIGLTRPEPGADFYDKDWQKNINDTNQFGNIDKWKAAFLPNYASRGVLEVGCGVGRLSVEFAKMGCDVLGFDISPWAIEQAKKRVKGTPYEESCQFEVGDAYNPPTKELFDTVMAIDVIEHLERPFDAMKAWYDRLRVNGHLIIFTPNAFKEEVLLRMSLGVEPEIEPTAHINMQTIWSLGTMANSLPGEKTVRFHPCPIPSEVSNPALNVFLLCDIQKGGFYAKG